MPWTLYFPFATVDDRVAAREVISLLRRDPAVESIAPTYVRGQPFVVTVNFREGRPERPESTDLYWRVVPFQLVPSPPPEERSAPRDDALSGRRTGSTMQSALETLRRFGEVLGEGIPTLGDRLTPELRENLISRAIETQEGRTRLAEAMMGPIRDRLGLGSMAAPLRARMDYNGTARRALVIDPLPEGAVPVYDRDPEPFFVPDWVKIGDCARYIGPGEGSRNYIGRVAEIKDVIDAGPEGTGKGHAFVRICTCYTDSMIGEDVVDARAFARLWEPCPWPPEPQDVFERLLGEDLL